MHPQASLSDSIITITHAATPGRARLKIPKLYRHEQLTARLEKALVQRTGIRKASASAITGSVLVVFDPAKDLSQVLAATQMIVDRLLTEVGNNETVTPPLSRRSFLKAAQTFAADLTNEVAGKKVRRENNPPDLGRPTDSQWKWHAESGERVLSYWVSSIEKGLSTRAAQVRLEALGENKLPQSQVHSPLKIFAAQMGSLPVMLLLGSSALSLVTGGVADAAIMLGVVLVNASIGFATENQTNRTIKSLTTLGERDATVLRDGVAQKVPIESLVPGDILSLSAGDQIPVDGRVLLASQFTVDESSLTGESVPVTKALDKLPTKTSLAERANMIYRGTVVTTGRATSIAVATGAETEIGKIQQMLSESEQPETPLQGQLRILGNQLVLMTGVVCGGVLIVGLLRRHPFLTMLKTAVSLAVAAIPEGLPAVATTTMALTVMKMRKHNMLVRKIDAVETLGAVQIICLDKTGTLTLNRMTVTQAFTHIGPHDFSEIKTAGDFEPDSEIGWLLRIAVLCNDSHYVANGAKSRLYGSPTENALIELAQKLAVSPDAIRETYPRIKTEYRSEGRSWMNTLHQTAHQQWLLAVKGRPEDVLAHCTHIQTGDEIKPLSPALRSILAERNFRMANDSLRVLAFAYRLSDRECKTEKLVWVGLTGMTDPERPGARELIAKFHRAGIKTVMLTGDQAPTATAIAKKLNLSGRDEIRVMDSSSLETEDLKSLSRVIEGVDVFARVTPSHKLRIVEAMQSTGKVVAMTGDGINDGPALKAADIGIAMGGNGTEMAREVGDIVLKEDDLNTVLAAVEQGRTTYDNVRKSIHFVLATNLSEVLVVFGAVSVTGGHPLSAMQLLWINLVTDIFPALALSMEAPESEVLNRPPREARAAVFSRSDTGRIAKEAGVMTVGALASFAYGVAKYGFGAQAQTMAFSNLTSAQLLHAYSCRSETESIFEPSSRPANRALQISMATGFLLQCASLWVPGVRRLLGTARLSPVDLLFSQGFAVANFLIYETAKYRRQNNPEVFNELPRSVMRVVTHLT
jgi:Ca2+-transporting ATPase